MMKQNLLGFMAGACILTVAIGTVGCSSAPQVNPNLVVYTREKMEDLPIDFPGGYNTDNFRKLTLALDFGEVAVDGITPELGNTINIRFQSELAKLNRFSVFAMHGNKMERLSELADLGEVQIAEPTDLATVDILCSGNIDIVVERKVAGRKQKLTYYMTLNLTCKELRTGIVKFTKDIDATVVRRQTLNSAGQVIAGFKPDQKSELETVVMDLAIAAAQKVANELGNSFPVGGRVTGMLGTEYMTMDKGTEQGIAKGMQMIVFTNVSGVDVALANAEASPGTNTSNLELWRLNTRNKYAARVLKEMEQDEHWLSKNKCYAVGYGMAMPPEWELRTLKLASEEDDED